VTEAFYLTRFQLFLTACVCRCGCCCTVCVLSLLLLQRSRWASGSSLSPERTDRSSALAFACSHYLNHCVRAVRTNACARHEQHVVTRVERSGVAALSNQVFPVTAARQTPQHTHTHTHSLIQPSLSGEYHIFVWTGARMVRHVARA
jgi:hypothetical protein